MKLPEATLALLHKRTEGWAAGLRLAALSLTGHPIRSGSRLSSPAASGRWRSTCWQGAWL